MFLGPAFDLPAVTLPASAQQAVDLQRPMLAAGRQPEAVVILLDIEAQGVAA